MMAIYNNIDQQEQMILDLVNNTISQREKELKKKNEDLKKRIEQQEAKQVVEQMSSDDSIDDEEQEDNLKIQEALKSQRKPKPVLKNQEEKKQKG